MTPAASEVAALAGELNAAATRLRDRLVEMVVELTAVDAPSGCGADAMADAAAAFAAAVGRLGTQPTLTPTAQGALIELSLGPAGAEPVLILGHYDTVWPAGTAAQRPATIANGVLAGPGTFDMRGGIVAALGALLLLGEQRLGAPVRLLLTPDEETGSACSRKRIVELSRAARCVFVLEPPLPDGKLKTTRSGWAVYEIEATGASAHAGLAPEMGVNAIDELCDALVDLRRVADVRAGTTLNVGAITGGTLPNLVAAHASAQLDVRTRTADEDARVLAAFSTLRPKRQGARLVARQIHARPAMERSPASSAAYAHAQSLAQTLGQSLGEGHSGGTSDANLIAPLGVAVIDGLGPEGAGAHATDERIVIDSLVQRSALLALLLAYPPEQAPTA